MVFGSAESPAPPAASAVVSTKWRETTPWSIWRVGEVAEAVAKIALAVGVVGGLIRLARPRR